MESYFELFGLKPGFELDLSVLEKKYQTQILTYHPDKFVNRSDKIKDQALRNTALINNAYEVLSSPLRRATYLLKLKNIDAFDEKDVKMDIDFLKEQIVLRERLEVAFTQKNLEVLEEFLTEIDTLINSHITKINHLFSEYKNLEKNEILLKIKELIRQLRFYEQLQKNIQQQLDKLL